MDLVVGYHTLVSGVQPNRWTYECLQKVLEDAARKSIERVEKCSHCQSIVPQATDEQSIAHQVTDPVHHERMLSLIHI